MSIHPLNLYSDSTIFACNLHNLRNCLEYNIVNNFYIRRQPLGMSNTREVCWITNGAISRMSHPSAAPRTELDCLFWLKLNSGKKGLSVFVPSSTDYIGIFSSENSREGMFAFKNQVSCNSKQILTNMAYEELPFSVECEISSNSMRLWVGQPEGIFHEAAKFMEMDSFLRDTRKATVESIRHPEFLSGMHKG